ncbi:hypothetical protein K439DRAFT_1626309, partial [Ramaria rubella]
MVLGHLEGGSLCESHEDIKSYAAIIDKWPQPLDVVIQTFDLRPILDDYPFLQNITFLLARIFLRSILVEE